MAWLDLVVVARRPVGLWAAWWDALAAVYDQEPQGELGAGIGQAAPSGAGGRLLAAADRTSG